MTNESTNFEKLVEQELATLTEESTKKKDDMEDDKEDKKVDDECDCEGDCKCKKGKKDHRFAER